MNNPYSEVTAEQSGVHLSAEAAKGYNQIYPSGSAHFYDTAQNSGLSFDQTMISGIFDRKGLDTPFSSGLYSRNYAITNFKVFNPYVHYFTPTSVTAYKVDVSGLLLKSTVDFNIYSLKFRP